MEQTAVKAERVILAGVHTGTLRVTDDTTDQSIAELERLADTAGAETVGVMVQNRPSPENATYLGEGKLEELKTACQTLDANLVIFDSELTPIQIRNLEKILQIRVIDRSMLILDIFARHADTREGKIQVELAQLKYLLPRLSGMGTQLSRLGGGIGTRGPGETKLETDRRHIRRRIGHLQEQLKDIKKHRELLRGRRKKDGIPVVALVGYTNAGKSTLLNQLTEANVLAEDKLFATLDPTIRSMQLPDGRSIYLVDTVGFIRKLPHHLIEAFKSTLEEAVYADVLLHVADASNPEVDQHIEVVERILQEIGAANKPTVVAFNKADLCTAEQMLPRTVSGADSVVELSGKTGKGLTALIDALAQTLPETKRRISVLIPFDKGAISARLHAEQTVLSEAYNADGAYMEVLADAAVCRELEPFILE